MKVDLVRPKKDEPRRRCRVIAAVCAVALVSAAGIYFAFFAAQAKPVMNFAVEMSIQVEDNNASQVRFIIPPAIGEPGAVWKTNVLSNYGIGGNYPLYTDAPVQNYSGFTVIHVKSSAIYNYTLGDFFAVWGYPIGPSETLTLPSHPPNSPNTIWYMCVGAAQNQLKAGNWGNETLTDGKQIILKYGGTSCMA